MAIFDQEICNHSELCQLDYLHNGPHQFTFTDGDVIYWNENLGDAYWEMDAKDFIKFNEDISEEFWKKYGSGNEYLPSNEEIKEKEIYEEAKKIFYNSYTPEDLAEISPLVDLLDKLAQEE